MNAAGAVLDDDQGVDAPQEHSVHMDEIGREDAAGLRGEEPVGAENLRDQAIFVNHAPGAIAPLDPETDRDP